MNAQSNGAYRAYKETLERTLANGAPVQQSEEAQDDYSAAALVAKADLARIDSKLGRLWYRIKYGKAAQLAVIVGMYPVFSGLMIAMVANTSLDVSKNAQFAAIVLVSGITVLGTIGILFFVLRLLKGIPRELW